MKKLLKKGFVAAACAATMLAGFGTAQAVDYDYIDLVTSAVLVATDYTSEARLEPHPNRAVGVNDAGQVVGFLKGQYSGKSAAHVFTWDLNSGGTATDLGLMGSTKRTAFAYGINEVGQIAGAYKTTVGRTQVYKPYTYDLNTGIQTNLITVITDPTAVALDINDLGQAVGWVSTKPTAFMESAPKRAYISNADGTISYIPGAYVGTEYGENLPGSSANAINNAGLVTGYTTVDGNWQAFLYDSATEAFTTLGTLGGGLTSVGTDVNELGVVVGYATRADGVERAFLSVAGIMVDLGALGGEGTSQAYGMNDKGDIVGTSNGHAFLYSNGQMVDLNDYVDPSLGITLTTAYGINNKGQIVGYGTGVDSVDAYGHVFSFERAFALTPKVTPTPVPASLLLFGSGLSGLALFRRRKQS